MKKTTHILLVSAFATIGINGAIFAADPAAATPVVVTTTATTAPTKVAGFAATEKTASFTPAQVTQIQDVIHDYLVKNPQVLVEASQALQAQQEKQMQASAMGAIAQNKSALFNDTQSPSVGNKDAAVTVVEFSDYQCGHCHEMSPIVDKVISQDKNVRFIFKELPIFGGMSQYAAKAALASEKQNKYYAFHTSLFSVSGPLTKEKVMEAAKKAGLNIVELNKDMALPTIDAQIKSNFQLAQALKIMGTPTFVVSNKAQDKFRFIPGATSINDLQTQIKSVQ